MTTITIRYWWRRRAAHWHTSSFVQAVPANIKRVVVYVSINNVLQGHDLCQIVRPYEAVIKAMISREPWGTQLIHRVNDALRNLAHVITQCFYLEHLSFLRRIGWCFFIPINFIFMRMHMRELLVKSQHLLKISDANLPFTLQRIQFPLRLSDSMTINKSQRQSFDHVGIFLPEPEFSYGQLYMAFSRARNWNERKSNNRFFFLISHHSFFKVSFLKCLKTASKLTYL